MIAQSEGRPYKNFQVKQGFLFSAGLVLAINECWVTNL